MNFKYAIIFTTLLLSTTCFAGAVSGGGGGVLPPVDNSVSVGEIREMLQNSKPVIWNTLKYIEVEKNYSTPSTTPVTKSLLEAHPNAFEIFDQIEILLSSKGCKDFAGNFVDGSINTPFRYGVCLSIDSLQKKINKDNYKSQILALMVHEMSHHLGTTEDEARAVQQEVILYFNSADKHELLSLRSEEEKRLIYINNADEFRTNLIGLSTRLRGGDPIMCASTSHLEFARVSLTRSSPLIDGYMYLTRDLYEKWYEKNWITIQSISNYICSIPGRGETDDNWRSSYRRKYDQGNIKFTSETDIANYIDGLEDDLNEYVKQVQALNLKFHITQEVP